MAHAHSNGENKDNVDICGDGHGKSATFHDFLGNKGTPAAGGGGRPSPEFLPSPVSDQGSERPVGNHLEGIPYYGSRGNLAVPETSYIFSGNKRSNSDSFMAPSRDKFPQGLADSQDSPVLSKVMRYSAGERPKHPHEEETSFGVNQMRPISASYLSQPSHGGRTDTNNFKWDRSIPVNLGPVLQYPPNAGLAMPLGYQTPSNRIKDTNVGSPVVSQIAADEGSRTGIKGSGILSSINLTGGISGRQPSGVLIRTGKQKSGICISEPESSLPSQHRTESTGRQMTIFYGGQAHVFDNIHPNKVDVIMALAGSNGGSWSTVYTPNSTARPSTGENRIPVGDSDVGASVHKEMYGRNDVGASLHKEMYGRNDVGASLLKEMYGKPSDKRDSYRGFVYGSSQGSIKTKETTDNSIKEAKGTGEKDE